jgi:catechol-2,3-dioxygenase
MTIDFDKPSDTVLKPSRFCHVVLRTNKFKEMVAFYMTFLGACATHENDFLSFLTYDDEHHRIAILHVPGTAEKNKQSCGLEHMAFAFDNLSDLCLAYRQRKARGIKPIWCVNHGPTTSM